MHYKYGAEKTEKNIDREKELISKVQQYDDKSAMKELTALYGGVLRNAISMSGVTTTGMDINTAMNYAEGYLKQAVKTYNEAAGVQPNTWVTRYVKNKLQNLKDSTSETASHMADDLSRGFNYDLGASSWLNRMGIEPTPENSYNFIKNEFKKGGEKLNPKKIERARMLSRREYSADRSVGGETSAEAMTYAEAIEDNQGVSGHSLLSEHQKKEEIKKILQSPEFSRSERIFIRQWVGLDEIGVGRTLKMHQAAMNAGISDAQARQAANKLKAKMKGI